MTGHHGTRAQECGTKRPFTHDGAVDAARKLSGKDAGRFHPYRCTRCTHWHVATRGRRKP